MVIRSIEKRVMKIKLINQFIYTNIFSLKKILHFPCGKGVSPPPPSPTLLDMSAKNANFYSDTFLSLFFLICFIFTNK